MTQTDLAVKETSSEAPELELLHIRVQGIIICIQLAVVERVLPLMSLSTVPGAPYFVAGLLNLHGHSMPVYDLGLFLHLPHPEPYTEDTPVILCNDGQRSVGIIAKEILGVARIDRKRLQMGHELETEGSPFDAVLDTSQGLALLLDHRLLLETELFHLASGQPIHEFLEQLELGT